MRLVPAYRERASALHAARATVSAALCLSLAAAAMLHEGPVPILAVLAAALLAGVAAGVGDEIRRGFLLALPLALLVALVNPLVSQEGQTLLVRGPELLGRRFDVTLEAVMFGALAGLRVIAIVVAFALFSACVDPDALLRAVRRFSYRSALTASLATRLVPVLARDATRMGDAARCRAVPARRAAVARAALSGALERAVDVAAALEVRGFALARPARAQRPPLSRHDVSVAAAAVAVLAFAVAGAALGVGGVEAYPEFSAEAGAEEAALAAAILAAALLPFGVPGSRAGVARV